MSLCGCLGMLLLGAPFFGGSSGARALSVHVDGVAALVGGRAAGPLVDVILRSDVELRARLSRVPEGVELPLAPIPDELLASTLRLMIDEDLIAREAKRLQVGRATAAAVLVERDRLVTAAGGSERVSRLLAAMGAQDEELDAIARRRVFVAAFLSANLDADSMGDRDVTRIVAQLRARTPLQIYATW